jgi:hypothetical protein
MASSDGIDLVDLRIARAGAGLRVLQYKASGAEAKPPEPPASLLEFLLQHTCLDSYDALARACDGSVDGLELLKPEAAMDAATRVPPLARAEEEAEETARSRLESSGTSVGRRGIQLESVRLAFQSAGVSLSTYGQALSGIRAHVRNMDFGALSAAASTLDEATSRVDLDLKKVLRAFSKTPYEFNDYAAALEASESSLCCTSAREELSELEAMWERLGDALKRARGRDNGAPPA